MSIFYIGLNLRHQYFSWLPVGINVMYSAAGFWNLDTRRWRRIRYIKQTGLKFLDPGGFTLLNKYDEHPFTIDEFLNLVAFLKPDYFSTPDYPCEPGISRSLGLQNNLGRIRKTVRNAAIVKRDLGMVECGSFVPVIQGYTLEEYQRCIDEHDKAGTIEPYMVVGSMCRRISNGQIRRLVVGIWEHAAQAGVKRLHFFGLKLSSVLYDLAPIIYSRDSAVALDSYDPQLREKRGGRRRPRGKKEKQEAFQSFFNRLDRLELKYFSDLGEISSKRT